MSKLTRLVERKIVRRVVADALKAGYKVIVDDGEEEQGPFNNIPDTMAALFSVDMENLVLIKGDRKHWVLLVYGNEGWDVVNDYSVHAEFIMEGANKLADKYCDYLSETGNCDDLDDFTKSELIRQNSY